MDNKLHKMQKLLSKLMVVSVGYGWEKFNGEDWDSPLANIRRGIQPVAVMMKGIGENVNCIQNLRLEMDNDILVNIEESGIVHIRNGETSNVDEDLWLSSKLTINQSLNVVEA